MNWYQYISIAAALLYIVSSWSMENGVRVKTSDNKEFILPQWKIEESRLLHTKQQWQLFKEKYHNAANAPIQLKTIGSKKLKLFAQALDVKDFPIYFESLGSKQQNYQQKLNVSEKQRLLICVAGEQELDSPMITQELVRTRLGFNLFEYINSYVSVVEVTDLLQRLIIRDNCEHKSFTQLPTKSYNYNILVTNNDTSYLCLPRLLRQQTNFSGVTLPSLRVLSAPELFWFIDNIIKTEEFISCVTPIGAIDKEYPLLQCNLKDNKKKLWMRKNNGDEFQWMEKIIQHSDVIEETIFSNNGKYLVTSSKNELVLTDLSIEDGKCIAKDTFLSGYRGEIKDLCFNNKSTILVVGAEKGIYFWDMNTRSLYKTIDCCGEIKCMRFNHNDTKLAILSFDETTQQMIVLCYNIEDKVNITKIFEYPLGDISGSLAFNLSGDTLIIETGHYVFLLDALTGAIIMSTEVFNEDSRWSIKKNINAVIMPYNIDILVTQTYCSDDNDEDKHICRVALWDIKSGKHIATLLENEQNLLGIGVSASGRSVVAIVFPYHKIQIDLYNENVAACLNWINKKSNLLQKYLLLRLFRACKLNDPIHLLDFHCNSPEHRILQRLLIEPFNVKELIEKYLLKKYGIKSIMLESW